MQRPSSFLRIERHVCVRVCVYIVAEESDYCVPKKIIQGHRTSHAPSNLSAIRPRHGRGTGRRGVGRRARTHPTARRRRPELQRLADRCVLAVRCQLQAAVSTQT